ncbi:DUF4229 domain-containing protein [Agromyces intestinalis]|uniref:DUF4229 domain-containing protein n=1 Tax=Agromyces intestinalis TaxID=2592652 RepID=A0A5C1YH89_9MICO|nr:DUF4229 domain-containing protein [Agromyces intestinalis]QEO14132.1 DUF4229 domain-containing protein [Agromyces intestinalis]
MKSVPVWIWYTVLRVALFAVPLVVLMIAGVDPWISVAVATLFGLAASLVFLRRARDAMSSDLYAARHREQPVKRVDDDIEDAVIDGMAQAESSDPAPRPAPREPEAE